MKVYRLILLCLIFFYFLSGCVQRVNTNPPTASFCRFPDIEIQTGFQNYFDKCGADVNPTSNPIGGGTGYTDLISINNADFVVSTVAELVNAIHNANSNDIIFLAGNSSFDLVSHPNLLINKSITIASDRGQNGTGARLYSTYPSDTFNLFVVEADRVRFTGLTLEGPHPFIGPEEKRTDGILFRRSNCIEVDNCEILYWSHAGIFVNSSSNIYIHHNYIHHCQARLGYGVVLGGNSEVLIEANRFASNRHDIAGSGSSGQNYEARYNIIISNANYPTQAHSFDMHCELESTHHCAPPYDIGGGIIQINHNTFLDGRNHGVRIRGNPEVGCWIQNNLFANPRLLSDGIPSLNHAIDHYPHVNKLFQEGNCAGEKPCFISNGAVGPWELINQFQSSINEIDLGDFNGDDRTDIFTKFGNQWRFSSRGAVAWQDLASSQAPFSNLRFGDFDGDGKTDVFTKFGNQWRFSSGGAAAWQDLASSQALLSALRFGDFDGDGKADVFAKFGNQWRFSSGGATAWQDLASSQAPLSNLRFGDFDGDGKTDVFTKFGNQWRFSSGGATAWQDLASSQVPLSNLRFGDFDGDGKTDIFRCE